MGNVIEANIKCEVRFSFTPQVLLRVQFVLRVDQLLMKGVWKFSMKGDGERCATMDLMQPQQKLFVTALDIQGIKLHIHVYKKTLIDYSN